MRRIAGLLALTSAIGIAQAAEMPQLFNNNEMGVLLSDDVLGAQRGKFVAGPKNHYFGIEFITHVVGPNGNTVSNGMQLNVNFNQKQPTMTVNAYSNETASITNATANSNIENGMPNGSGLVQVAQIAGNANSGINDFSFVPGNMQIKGASINQGHYQLKMPQGMVRYEFNNSGIGMAYTSGDNKVTSAQMVRNSNGNQGFVQQFSIADNNKLLSNETKFYMGDKIGAYTDLAKALQQQLPMGIR